MCSKGAKKAEQQRQRRERARAAVASAAAETGDANQPGANQPISEHVRWQHERPPRLQEDFGGEFNRAAYEVVRAEWYADNMHGQELPPFDAARCIAR